MVRGDAQRGVQEIGRLMETIRRLSDLPRRTAVEAQEPLNKLLRAEFKTGTDPYGKPWAPLRPATLARGRRPPPLTDTKRLRDGTIVRLRRGGRAGLEIVAGAPYGYFHQVGTRHMVARPILPDRGVPASWRRVLEAAARRAAKQAVR